MPCTQKLVGFLQRSEFTTGNNRLIESDPVPDDVRYRVLAGAKGRCTVKCRRCIYARVGLHQHLVPEGLEWTTQGSLDTFTAALLLLRSMLIGRRIRAKGLGMYSMI